MSRPFRGYGRGRGKSHPRRIPSNQGCSYFRPQPSFSFANSPNVPNTSFRPRSPVFPSFTFFPDHSSEVIPAAPGTIPGSSPRSSSPVRRRPSHVPTPTPRRQPAPTPSTRPRPANSVPLTVAHIRRIRSAYNRWINAGRSVERATFQLQARGTQLRDALYDAHALSEPVSDESDWDEEGDSGIAFRRGPAPQPQAHAASISVAAERVARLRSSTPPLVDLVNEEDEVDAPSPSPSPAVSSVDLRCSEEDGPFAPGDPVIVTLRSPSPTTSESVVEVDVHQDPGTPPQREPVDLRRRCVPPIVVLDRAVSNSLPASPSTIANTREAGIIVTRRWCSAGRWCPHAARRRPVMFDTALPPAIRELAEHVHSAPVSSDED